MICTITKRSDNGREKNALFKKIMIYGLHFCQVDLALF